MSNYPDDFKGTNMDEREQQQEEMLDNMFRNRKQPITVADTVGNPTAGMSPFGAALFNCFKSPKKEDQTEAMRNLIGE